MKLYKNTERQICFHIRNYLISYNVIHTLFSTANCIVSFIYYQHIQLFKTVQKLSQSMSFNCSNILQQQFNNT